MHISRANDLRTVTRRLAANPAVALLGARQVGKTTLARDIASQSDAPTHWFDLEDRSDLARLAEPELALRGLEGLIVIDEVQRRPDLFPTLRVLIDADADRRFLLLGSASVDLLRQSSESLAGRIAFHHLTPISARDYGADRLDELWLRGGFPRSLLSASDDDSFEWRRDFIATFLARDLPAIASIAPSPDHERFLFMLAHLHGQVWNANKVATALGIPARTVAAYIGLLEHTYIVRRLTPWHENLSKRQVRRPKIYIADPGLLHALLDITTRTNLERHPVIGVSWESLAIDQIQHALALRRDQMSFWATHSGAELDLFVSQGERRIGFEIKRTVAPKITRSLRSAIDSLALDHAFVVHGGDATFPLASNVTAIAMRQLVDQPELLAP